MRQNNGLRKYDKCLVNTYGQIHKIIYLRSFSYCGQKAHLCIDNGIRYLIGAKEFECKFIRKSGRTLRGRIIDFFEKIFWMSDATKQ